MNNIEDEDKYRENWRETYVAMEWQASEIPEILNAVI